MAKFFISPSAEIFAQTTGMSLGEFRSVEAGAADGLRHFDHHGPHGANPAPCRDDRMTTQYLGDTPVVITHMDADTLVGILRMWAGYGRPGVDFLQEIDFELMEKVDLNGSSVVDDPFNPTILFMVGIGEAVRALKFPRPSADGPADVSALVEQLLDMSAKNPLSLVAMGAKAQAASEESYRHCRKDYGGEERPRLGLWVVGRDDPFDPSRPYRDGCEVVVVFRRHYESISIYCSPDSDWAFGGKEVGGIQFAGHPKAAGSPRGQAFTEADAGKIFDALAEVMGIDLKAESLARVPFLRLT